MQRYLEPGVDLALTLGLIFLLRPFAHLLAYRDVLNLFITVPAAIALLLGFVLLRHVESAVPSWADSVEMPFGKWSGLVAIYGFMLGRLCVGLIIAYTGVAPLITQEPDVPAVGAETTIEEYQKLDAAMATQEQLGKLLMFALIVFIVVLLICMLYKPQHQLPLESKRGLVYRGSGLLFLNFALLVYASFARLAMSGEERLSDVFAGFSHLSIWDPMLLILVLLGPMLTLLMYSLPLHYFTRAYNLFWLRSATYALNLLVAAFMVMW